MQFKVNLYVKIKNYVFCVNLIDVMYIVNPVDIDGNLYYRLSMTRKEGVADFEPILYDSTLYASGEEFRSILLTKGKTKQGKGLIF